MESPYVSSTIGGSLHWQAHVNIIFSAEGMCNCVDISNVGFGEGTACEIGGAEHISSCFNIIAVCVGGIQIFKDQSDSIQAFFLVPGVVEFPM